MTICVKKVQPATTMVLKTRNNNTYSQQPFHKIDFKVHAINNFFLTKSGCLSKL
jgi:hypothetical protein